MNTTDNDSITIRPLAAKKDSHALDAFFSTLNDEDLLAIHIEKARPETMNAFTRMVQSRQINSVVAQEKDGSIIGFAMLKIPLSGWLRNIGQIKLVVHPKFRKQGIARRIIHAIFQVSLKENTHTIMIELLPGRTEVEKAVQQLGFQHLAVLEGLANDMVGRRTDLHVYTLDINAFWDTVAYGKQFGRSMEY